MLNGRELSLKRGLRKFLVLSSLISSLLSFLVFVTARATEWDRGRGDDWPSSASKVGRVLVAFPRESPALDNGSTFFINQKIKFDGWMQEVPTSSDRN